jgi:hypothetical protein
MEIIGDYCENNINERNSSLMLNHVASIVNTAIFNTVMGFSTHSLDMPCCHAMSLREYGASQLPVTSGILCTFAFFFCSRPNRFSLQNGTNFYNTSTLLLNNAIY